MGVIEEMVDDVFEANEEDAESEEEEAIENVLKDVFGKELDKIKVKKK